MLRYPWYGFIREAESKYHAVGSLWLLVQVSCLDVWGREWCLHGTQTALSRSGALILALSDPN